MYARMKKRNVFRFLLLAFVIGPFALLPLLLTKHKVSPKVDSPLQIHSDDLLEIAEIQLPHYVEPTDARVAACPSCGSALNKVPGAKTKCPHCGEFMFVRTDSKTNSRVVVTADEVEAIEDEWAKINGTWDDRKQQKDRFSQAKSDLSEQFGTTASDSDVNWRLLNEDSIAHSMRTRPGRFSCACSATGSRSRAPVTP